MPDESNSYNTNDADVFSRGSLKLTYDLIRKQNAKLALEVRNITGGEPLPKAEPDTENAHSDHFRVDLDSFQVRAVVEALMEQAQSGIEGNNNPGMAIMAKTLIEDWMALARKMISELPKDSQP